MMNIKEEIKKKERELESIKEMQDIIEYLERHESYYMIEVIDENGETMTDENGDTIKEEPTEDSYGFTAYFAYHTAKKLIEDYITKVLK